MKSKFKINDRVFSLLYGWGIVTDIIHSSAYPIMVKSDNPMLFTRLYTNDGKYYLNSEIRTLLTKEEVETNPDIRRFINFLLFEVEIKESNVDSTAVDSLESYIGKPFMYRDIPYVCTGFKHGVLLDENGKRKEGARRVFVETENSVYPLEECIFLI